MNLYLVTIKANKSFYVIADDPTSAYEKLLECLKKGNLYFATERKLKCVQLIGEIFYETDLFDEVI